MVTTTLPATDAAPDSETTLAAGKTPAYIIRSWPFAGRAGLAKGGMGRVLRIVTSDQLR